MSVFLRSIGGWLALVLFCSLGGCGSGKEPKRIMLLTNGNSPFWDAARAGLEAAAKDLDLEARGYRAVQDVNDGTPQGQLNKLRQYGTQSDIVAIGVSAIDAGNLAIIEELRKLHEKGVHVITVDSDVDRDKYRDARFAFVGTDNFAGGRELGVAARNLRPEGGGYVTFVGRTGAQNAIERVTGFQAGAGDAFRSLDNMGDEMDRTTARNNVRTAIRNHGADLKTLVGIWSYNAPAIVDVVGQLERRGDFTIVTFDAEPVAVQEMEKGNIDAMVVQNPFEMGYQGVRLMKALVEDDRKTIREMLPNAGRPDGDVYDTGLKVVAPDEGSPLKKEMFSEKTTFLGLSEFKAWLSRYGLTGS